MEPVTLNETALAGLAENKRPIFIYEWLRMLDRILSTLAADQSSNDSNQVGISNTVNLVLTMFLSNTVWI